jgi:hypothetical protein
MRRLSSIAANKDKKERERRRGNEGYFIKVYYR